MDLREMPGIERAAGLPRAIAIGEPAVSGLRP